MPKGQHPNSIAAWKFNANQGLLYRIKGSIVYASRIGVISNSTAFSIEQLLELQLRVNVVQYELAKHERAEKESIS